MSEEYGGDLGEWVDTTPDERHRDLIEGLGLRSDIFEPYKTYETVFDSNGNRWKAFLMNPLPFLKGEKVKVPGHPKALDPVPIPPVAAEPEAPWKIRTVITNHHKPLNPRVISLRAVVETDDYTIDLTATKHEE